jgi:hypothetical protein
MDSSQGSSFIPKAPVRGAVNKRRVRRVYVFTYLIYIVFTCSLLAAAGFWFVHYTADKKLADAQLRLTEERNKFNDSDVATVMQLNERMEEAEALIANHVSLVRALEAVEAVTVASVAMTGLQYTKEESARLSFSLVARTDDFNSARYQREVLSANPVLAGATLANVSFGVSDTGTESGAGDESVVSFHIEKTLEPGAIAPVIDTANLVPDMDPSDVPVVSDDAAAVSDDAVFDAVLVDTE